MESKRTDWLLLTLAIVIYSLISLLIGIVVVDDSVQPIAQPTPELRGQEEPITPNLGETDLPELTKRIPF